MQNPQDPYTKKLYEIEVAKANATVKFQNQSITVAKWIVGGFLTICVLGGLAAFSQSLFFLGLFVSIGFIVFKVSAR